MESVQEDIRRLCFCLLDTAFQSACDRDTLLSSLQSPSKKAALDEQQKAREVRSLVHLAYDLLLLRKWTWFGSWEACTPLSPLCWCLAYGYGYHVRGRDRQGARLTAALTAFFSDCDLADTILQFLALLADDLADQPSELLDVSGDSGVFCYSTYPSSLFEQLPASSQLTPINQAIASTLFTCTPGSGFRGFLSAEPLSANKTPVASSLFDGLTHSTTASLNSPLHIPTLPSHPHLLHFLPDPPGPPMAPLPTHPPHSAPSPPPPPTSIWTCKDDRIPARGWEGWMHSGPYLTEAGEKAVGHAHFLSRANLPSCIEGPLKPHPSHVTPPLSDEVPSLEVWQEGGSLERAFGSALCCLQQYLQTMADGYMGGTAMEQLIGSHAMKPLEYLLWSTRHLTKRGLSLVDTLYSGCCAGQGTPHYPLLLSLLTSTITPYTHFLSQWLFRGWLDEGEEFGIHSNHRALQCRDGSYWFDGYTATEPCTPTFLSQYSQSILACGKALNLLRICCPQHPLCGRVSQQPPVTIATSYERLEQLTQQCQGYIEEVCQMIDEERSRRQQKAEAMHQEAIQDVLVARRAARVSVLAARDQEQQLVEQQRRAKVEWYHELKTRAMKARLLRAELEAEERERDRQMVAVLVSRDDALSAHERKLAEEARAELVGHYAALGREAEQRKQRAKWREARWRLASRRQQWLEEETEKEAVMIADTSLSTAASQPPDTGHKETPAVGEPEIGHEGTATLREPQTSYEENPSPDTENEGPPAPGGPESEREGTPALGGPESEREGTPALGGPESEREGTPALGDQPAPPAQPSSRTRGLSPPSTVQHIIYPVGVVNSSHTHTSSRGRPPPSTVQDLLYPAPSETPDQHPLTSEATPTSSEPLTMPSEPYILAFPQLDETPRSDLLTAVIGPIPVQNGTETDCMLLPLPSLLNRSLSLPLLTQNYLVNSALLDHFLTSCHVTIHFLSLKRFLLLEDGEFAHSLATQLFHKLLMSGGDSASMTSSAFLNPLLQSALGSSLHGDEPNAQLLSFAVCDPPALIHPHAVDALDFLQLRYKVEWPCNIVITESTLKKYNEVFHLLLQLRRASWTLKNVFTQLQRCEGLEKWQQRQLQIQRHELQHFVDIMQGYITNQLFYLSWRELEDDLTSKVDSLDGLIAAHQNFIDKAIFRCLLSKKAAAVMKIIQTIFSLILQFCTTLTSSVQPSPHHHYHTMCHTHRRFRETAGLLMKVIMKLVERGYQPHLEDFLLRLNFNNFYG